MNKLIPGVLCSVTEPVATGIACTAGEPVAPAALKIKIKACNEQRIVELVIQ